METNPDPSQPLPEDADLVVIGDEDSERRFLERFWSADDDRHTTNKAKSFVGTGAVRGGVPGTLEEGSVSRRP
jgi:hypothetical protein